MERISIFNYEAFYLDFLEGNLNEEDAALLLEFLDANPDLKMEDDLLPQFDADEIELSSSVKQDLKQTLADDHITLNNAPYFMISSAEGLLDSTKSDELTAFIGQNESLKSEQTLYSSVYFAPDLSITYPDKKGLKHKKVFVLWPYVTTAAAACIIAFFLIWSSMNSRVIDENNAPVLANDVKEKAPLKDPKKEGLITDKKNKILQQNDNPKIADRTNSPNQKEVIPVAFFEKRPEPITTAVGNMKKIPAHEVLTSFNERTIEPITKKTYSSPQSIPAERDYALVHFNEMQNPIEPITKFIGEKTKRDIEFRTTKKTDNKPGGFFLKIGKFELSNKKH